MVLMYENGWIRKIKLTSKFMTSQPCKQIIAKHILSNISRSKDNQAVKFVQFLNTLCTKCGGKPEKLKLSISLD